MLLYKFYIGHRRFRYYLFKEVDLIILSVSRRTDIPNYFIDWFLNRLEEGFLYVKNPMNSNQISKIIVTPDIVDCIVFWTKNPINMIKRLDELMDYKYYFQFTLTGYDNDIEPNLPNKKELLLVFQELSNRIGHKKVIWRYDPILLNSKYTIEYHIRTFEEFATKLNGYTDKVIISFMDNYAKTKRNTKDLILHEITNDDMIYLASNLAEIANVNGMLIESCAENIDLISYGVQHGSCIDKKLIEDIIGYPIGGNKDRNQRSECGCYESVEVGTYNTCKSGCKYCYANYNIDRVKECIDLYDVNSPILCSNVDEGMKIAERKVKSSKI